MIRFSADPERRTVRVSLLCCGWLIRSGVSDWKLPHFLWAFQNQSHFNLETVTECKQRRGRQKAGKLSGCGRHEFRVLQLLQDSRQLAHLRSRPLANGPLPNLSNAVANKEYIERLQMVIRQLHECDAVHIGTQPVKEVFQGQTIWDGRVEVFDVTGHPRAKRAYAWSQEPRDTTREVYCRVGNPPG